MHRTPLPALQVPDFALTPGETLAGGLRRLSVGEFEHSLQGLSDPDTPRDVAIHEMRKSAKRVRALLRMVRPALGEKVYRFENDTLREAAAQVSGVRDGVVMVEAVERIRSRYGRLLATDVFATTEDRLRSRHERLARRVLDDDEVLSRLTSTLYKARSRYAAWPIDPSDPRAGKQVLPNRWTAVGAGVSATYRRGRREMELAYQQPTPEHFHSWRKRVKYLRYQMEILSPLWWEVVGGLASSLDTLGEVLGEEHDLAELTRLVTTVPDLAPDPDERSLLVALALHRRHELQNAARVMGSRVYAETPDQFGRRLRAYWDAWTLTG
ncbi:MAG TPA: CHAD domain-containing protein [Acidimicrobiia bacterium]|nr:CHAD domain-containing protein [Acidimicrobiia bacterium]